MNVSPGCAYQRPDCWRPFPPGAQHPVGMALKSPSGQVCVQKAVLPAPAPCWSLAAHGRGRLSARTGLPFALSDLDWTKREPCPSTGHSLRGTAEATPAALAALRGFSSAVAQRPVSKGSAGSGTQQRS